MRSGFSNFIIQVLVVCKVYSTVSPFLVTVERFLRRWIWTPREIKRLLLTTFTTLFLYINVLIFEKEENRLEKKID